PALILRASAASMCAPTGIGATDFSRSQDDVKVPSGSSTLPGPPMTSRLLDRSPHEPVVDHSLAPSPHSPVPVVLHVGGDQLQQGVGPVPVLALLAQGLVGGLETGQG